jgi:methylthioribose-1-phosphate isomerase
MSLGTDREERTDTLWWDEEAGALVFLDQTLLPGKEEEVSCTTVDHLIDAIQRLAIRGAPALGVAGAYGVAIAAQEVQKNRKSGFVADITSAAAKIASARPTAVNLSWGVNRVMNVLLQSQSHSDAFTLALSEARRIADEDTASCHAIGENGAALLPNKATVLTHCNAGALACSAWGTALGVIRSAVASGKDIKVIACETRPLLQGARLTAWELSRDGIPVTVIPDSVASFLMRRGEIDAVVVGADRITQDAVFNKVGTYMHAVSARHHNVPFYVAAPLTTFDRDHLETEIEIEERPRDEVASVGYRVVVPRGVMVRNPAFDATPHGLVTAFVTDKGVFFPPLDFSVLYARTIQQESELPPP